MKKKIIIVAVVAIVLIAVLAFMSVFSRRDNNDEQTDETTTSALDTGSESGNTNDGYDENGYILDNIPEDTDFNDAEITFLIWEDCPMREFYSDEMSGDIIGDAIYERNLKVEERIGVTLSYVSELGNDTHMTDFMKKAENDITSGACEYDIFAGYSRTAPAMALTGIVEELTDLDYLDFDMPWWPDTLIDKCMINDKLYYCSGDISTNLLWMMIATFFNKELIASQGLENPYDLVLSGQWTLDKFIEMTTNRYVDIDGGGTVDEGDFFGFNIYDTNIDAFFTAAGFSILDRDSNGDVVTSPTLGSQNIYDLLDKLGSYFSTTSDVAHNNTIAIRTIFFEERSIFTMDRVFIVAGKDYGSTDKIEFEYGIVPNAKYDESQENYSTNVGHPFTMYAISTGAFDANACAALLECLGSESYRTVTPMVFESAMKIKYASDETTTAMYDILRETVSFDLGRFYSSQTGNVYSAMRSQVLTNSKTFASQLKVLSKVIDNGIKTISAAYAD